MAGGISVRTFLFSDVEGSTQLLDRVGDRYSELLLRHQIIIRHAVRAVGGVEHGTDGDSFFVSFASASDAVAAAVQAQRTLLAETWPDDAVIRVRMGLHVGEMAETEAGLVGLAINHAARIGSSAHGGQIVVSESVRALAGRLPDGVELLRLGRFGLRDVGVITLFQVTHRELQTTFPSLRSVVRSFGNVTSPLSALIGREVEVGVVTGMVGSSRLVTLAGAGGSGKTRLAVEVAFGLVDVFADGVWMVELAPLSDPAWVGSTLASVLGVKLDPSRSVDECLVETLADRDILIVLDNCEHVLDTAARLAERLVRSCPRLVVLATSRESLSVTGEAVYRVASLPYPHADSEPASVVGYESVQLFLERAREHDAGFGLDDADVLLVGAICRRLDGMPLAIELAAARTRSMSIVDFHARLDDRFRLLTGGSRTALPRQQTLRALIDWSYDALTNNEQVALDRLSVFAGGFELESAQAALVTAEMDMWEAVEVIGSLVDKSLIHAEVRAGVSRYRLLETVRQYAAERLVHRDADTARAARRAHCEVFLDLVETAAPELHGPDQLQWLRRLERDLENLRAALMHCVDDSNSAEQGVRLAVGLRMFYYRTGKLYDELIDALTRLVDDPALPVHRRADALFVLGNMSRIISAPKAQSWADPGLALALRLGDIQRMATQFVSSADVATVRGEHRLVIDYCDEAVRLARACSDHYVTAWALGTKAAALSEVGEAAAAENAFAQSFDGFRAMGDHWAQSVMLRGLGSVELAAERYSEARKFFEDSDSARLASGAAQFSEIPLYLGMADYGLGNHDSARKLFREVLEIDGVRGDWLGLAYGLLAAALSTTQLGRFPEAIRLHGAADRLLTEIGAIADQYLELWRQQDLAALHDSVQPRDFDVAYEFGQQMTRPQALALAIDALTE